MPRFSHAFFVDTKADGTFDLQIYDRSVMVKGMHRGAIVGDTGSASLMCTTFGSGKWGAFQLSSCPSAEVPVTFTLTRIDTL